MAIARVVMFEDVDASRMSDLQQRMEAGDRPEGLPPVEVIVLHDADGARALVVQVFANDDDYRAAKRPSRRCRQVTRPGGAPPSTAMRWRRGCRASPGHRPGATVAVRLRVVARRHRSI